MRGLRAGLGALVGLLGLWALAAVFAPAREAAPARTFTSSRQCRECHPQVYAEWESSWHRESWRDPDVVALSNNFANTDCIDCHAPRPVLETGIGMRVLPRSSRRSEGVDCISCHALPGGGVAGTIDAPGAPCRPVATLDLQRPDFCGGCHDQHQTVQQWKESRYFDEGVSCMDCHMPFREGDPNLGRDHRCLGGHDMDLVRSAVELRGVREGDGWVIELENVGAGHSFPTDERSRAADLFWRPATVEGATPAPWRHFYRIRSPYRHEVDIIDNLLAAHETRRIPLPGQGAVEVALYYRLTPYYAEADPALWNPVGDANAFLVDRLELSP
ncbi:MAG: NapC/NirT family cytochrome c [Planctomycetota bacterium]|nr:NapC/NirT family cytochrome c [Planctomycetota bacterium]MDP6762407.1 NapC/NirT family cytochrome c [Planctomycetota bacterium]MDP6989543.1 NapC/NirT family cytochrome c [Planctomycetota bacterium]